MADAAAEEFARLAIALHEGPSVEDSVEKVLEFALQATGADYAGISFVDGRRRIETAAVTDRVVAELDEIQTQTGEGPDIFVLDDRLSVIVADVRTDGRWPAWAAAVASRGIRSVLSVRMYTTGAVVGTLNVYARDPEAFDVDDQGVAHILARHAAVAFASARKIDHLWQAVDARKRIGQAQGILMERFDLDDDQAFAVLRRYSQDNNVKLRQVADMLVETRKLPEAE